ncbi:hypothetical protein [Nocardia exalbida]|uniref:hypothetical protein n=1 Tax=Nocardia exalbida TaxID=290231 RepID=UPI000307FB0D|nr:hypothetical protein [Nocardia exalbida]
MRLSATDATRAAARLNYWQETVFTSADAKEGAQAFLAKRPPVAALRHVADGRAIGKVLVDL